MALLKTMSKLWPRCAVWSTSCRSTTAKNRRFVRSLMTPDRIETAHWIRLIPENPNTPYDMKELITKIADEGDFYEIQEDLRQEHRHWLHPPGRANRRCRGQPAHGPGRMSGYRQQHARRRVSCASVTAFEIPILTLGGCARLLARNLSKNIAV